MECKMEKSITLILNEKEAGWLKSQMQNQVFCEKCSDEIVPENEIESEDSQMRKMFFDALKSFDIYPKNIW